MKKIVKKRLIMLVALFILNIISVSYVMADGGGKAAADEQVDKLKELVKEEGMVPIYTHFHTCSFLEGVHVTCRTYPYWLRCCRNQCGSLVIGK